MFAQSVPRRSMAVNISEIEKRLQLLERNLDGAVGRASASAVDTADHVRNAIASALAGVIDQFRGGTSAVSGEAAKIGTEAAKLGSEAMRRLSKEVEHRPLVLLAVAVGVGILVGLAHRRH